MKTRIIFLIAAVALVTLSFTFASVQMPESDQIATQVVDHSAPVGGLYADEVLD